MPGRVPASYGSWSGTGTDQRYVPLSQTTCLLLYMFKTGVACCLPTRAQGLLVPVMESFGFGVFLGLFGFSSLFFVHVGSTSLPSLPVVYKT